MSDSVERSLKKRRRDDDQSRSAAHGSAPSGLSGEVALGCTTTDARGASSGPTLRQRETAITVVGSELARGEALAAELRQYDTSIHVTVLSLNDDRCEVLARLGNVAAIALGCGDGLKLAVDLTSRRPWVQVVFWIEGSNQLPEVVTARTLGIGRLVPDSRIAQWLAVAAQPLDQLARGKRMLFDAERRIPEVHFEDDSSSSLPALPVAEQRFRETYLRALLSQSRSQREAASNAGIPYTTLCSMVKKLGL